MNDYVVCDRPGTFDCLFLNIIWAIILRPLEGFFAFFGLDFTWELYAD